MLEIRNKRTVYSPAGVWWEGVLGYGEVGYTPIKRSLLPTPPSMTAHSGHPKQYILVDTIFNCRFDLDFQEMSSFKSSKHTFVAPPEPAPKRCIFRTFLKAFSWKSQMKPVVKDCVY